MNQTEAASRRCPRLYLPLNDASAATTFNIVVQIHELAQMIIWMDLHLYVIILRSVGMQF